MAKYLRQGRQGCQRVEMRSGRMLKKPASFVLDSSKSSTYPRGYISPSFAAALLGTRRVSAHQGWAGEKSGLFEHPAWCSLLFQMCRSAKFWRTTIVFPQPASPHYSGRFVAKSLSRVARPARGALRPRGVLVQYGEGPRGESAGRRLVIAADRRLQQKRS
jgi:hypothetical protein